MPMNTRHTCGVTREDVNTYRPIPPQVWMCNEDDPHYEQRFEDWRELNDFIEKLKASGNEAWGTDAGTKNLP